MSTVVPSSNAINPMIPKITKPAKNAVNTFPVATITASLINEFELVTYLNRRVYYYFRYTPKTVVVEFVVTRQSDQPTPARRKREEDLHGCIPPNACLCKLIPLWGQVKHNAVSETRQSGRTYQKDRQNNVREECSEIDSLKSNIKQHMNLQFKIKGFKH